MKDIEVRKFGAWQIATAIGVGSGFVGWAKMGPITGSSPIDEPGEHVWFEFGKTREEVIDKLQRELGLISAAPSELPQPLPGSRPRKA